jgi:hypothetical protein
LYSLLIFCRDLSLFFRVCMLLLHGLVEEQEERKKEIQINLRCET